MKPISSEAMVSGTPQADATTLYQALKERVGRVRGDRRLAVPPAFTATAHSPTCGSTVTLDAEIEDGRIRELGHRVRACSLGQAATAMLLDRAAGLTGERAATIREQLAALLRSGEGRCDWPEFEVFAHAQHMPARHGSALLPFDALEQLFNQARQGTRPATPEQGVDITLTH
ncbi:MAG: iron-sulfur cluster assembly scaffold protein [Pseudoxanthomonas suwonensis]|nr:iron-sulfur cluster assembly scaffold protein [Pseudoxanthomonas suwonensis]